MKKILQGQPLRQPLHVLLVHLPIGVLLLSFIMDLVNLPRTYSYSYISTSLAKMSFYMIALGLIGMIVASLPGLVDYSAIGSDSPAKRTAWLHLWVNIFAFLTFAGSFAMRLLSPDRMGVPTAPFILSAFGVGFLSYSGYLGGKLVYEDGVGVGRHRRQWDEPEQTIPLETRPDGWCLVGNADELKDRQTLRVRANGFVIAIAKVDGQFYAFQEYCTHRFGPLSEGCFKDGKVMCPWHRSEFDLTTGQVAHGPAKMNIKTFEVAVRDGQLLLKTPREPRPSSVAPPGSNQSEPFWRPPEQESLPYHQPAEPNINLD